MQAKSSALRRRVRRVVMRHRPLLVAALLGAALVAAVATVRPPAAPTELVAVAAHDLEPGRALTADDVTAVELDPALVPDGTYSPADAPFGRVVAGPVRSGEPVTDVAVVGPDFAAGLPAGHVLTTVSVRTPADILVQPGDLVRVVATDPRATTSEVVSDAATVVVVPETDPATRTEVGATMVVLGVPEDEALGLTAASTAQVLDLLVPARGSD